MSISPSKDWTGACISLRCGICGTCSRDLLPAGAELDLVMLERAWPGLAERVRREGVLLDVAA